MRIASNGIIAFNSVLLVLFLFTACASDDSGRGNPVDGDAEVYEYDENEFESEMDMESYEESFDYRINSDGSVAIFKGDREFLSMLGVEVETFSPDVSMIFGQYTFEKKNEQKRQLQLIEKEGVLNLAESGKSVGIVSLSQTDSGNLRVSIKLNNSAENSALNLRFSCRESDLFWGFGEQYSFVDLRGQIIPIWVSEQGLGRSPEPQFPFSGSLTDSYFPMPYFIDPKTGTGFLLENTEYSSFDLCSSLESEWTVEVWNGEEASFLIFPGPKAVDVIEQLAAEVGKPAVVPPDWAFNGVWLAAQGGSEAISMRLETALDAGIPVTALWVQDWVGLHEFSSGQYGVKYHWSWDQELYPNLSESIADMNSRGVHFLGYFNPFVVPQYEHYQEMEESNYLIRNTEGDVYNFTISTLTGSLIDLSNPDAVEYFKGFARIARDMGISGWMSDFGEWLPYDAVLHAGNAPESHNMYPTAWHKASLDVLQETDSVSDFILLTRSGYTGEQKVAQIVWAGDQEASFDEYDGLPTVVTAGLTLGLSAIPFFTLDIAGFSGGPSSKELFWRWTELGAFSPVMRTHDGLRKTENWRFDSDAETLKHFKFMADVHTLLLPYFKDLAQEAVKKGLPIIRHTVLIDPDWSKSFNAHKQWMIGDDILFAPIVTENANTVEVYFPDGNWEHIFTAQSFTGRQVVTVDAPLGLPAVFIRAGAQASITAAIRDLYDNSGAE